MKISQMKMLIRAVKVVAVETPAEEEGFYAEDFFGWHFTASIKFYQGSEH
tara:strand:+ start:200 stop:349 length:150 start_codon:yes stop_codon:yes gene_type:complete